MEKMAALEAWTSTPKDDWIGCVSSFGDRQSLRPCYRQGTLNWGAHRQCNQSYLNMKRCSSCIIWYMSCVQSQINGFWSQVSDEIFRMTTYRLRFCPESILLNQWEDDLPYSLEQTVSILLTLAKLEVASKWKDSKGPSLTAWYDRIWNCFVLAKLTDKILKETNSSYRTHQEEVWSGVLQYLEDLKIAPPAAVSQFVSTPY